MGSPLLIWVLGLLTLATGALLLVMWRRRREAPLDDISPHQMSPGRSAKSPSLGEVGDVAGVSSRRLVDAYAIPVAYDKPPKRVEEREPGKICPACGSRYAYHYRVCSRDDSELATLN
jgi:hypothetical protein